jgi:hypothetical protein
VTLSLKDNGESHFLMAMGICFTTIDLYELGLKPFVGCLLLHEERCIKEYCQVQIL